MPLDPHALAQLRADAARTQTDALILLQDGEVLVDDFSGGERRVIETMSVTKTVVNLVVGRAITLRYIESVDEPVASYFPEWRQGRKRHITLRHLMTHTSGLQNVPTTGEEIYPSEDHVQLALCAELDAEPGRTWAYNNKAVNLLAGVVKRATNRRMDEFARDQLFTPLGIRHANWTLDRSGNPGVMAGLGLLAVDLARLANLLLTGGVHEGVRLLRATWVEDTLRPCEQNPNMGLLWFLAPGEPDGPPRAVWHSGHLGQYVVVVPTSRLVAVRQLSWDSPAAQDETTRWDGFVREVIALAAPHAVANVARADTTPT